MSIPLTDEATEIHAINLLLNNPELCASEIFQPDLLTGKRREISDAILKLYSKGVPVTPHSIGTQIGNEEITTLCWKYMARGSQRDSWEYLCNTLLDRSLRRRVDGIIRGFHALIHEDASPIQEAISDFEKKLFTASSSNSTKMSDGSNITTLKEELKWRAQNPGQIRGLSFGMTRSGQMLDGLKPGTLTVIAARPSVGKTAFLTSMITNHLMTENATPGVFSLEMRGMRIQQRILARISGVSMTVTRNRPYTDSELEKLHRGTKLMEEFRWFYSETPRMSIQSIGSEMRQLVRNKGVNVVYVDYLQLIRNKDHEQDDRMRISSCMEGLKLGAEELGIPIVVAAQLKRQEGVFERKTSKTVSRPPRLEDLKGSGSIEEDSDVVGLLDRDQVSNSEWAVMHWAKNRDGETGVVPLAYSPETTTFAESDS